MRAESSGDFFLQSQYDGVWRDDRSDDPLGALFVPCFSLSPKDSANGSNGAIAAKGPGRLIRLNRADGVCFYDTAAARSSTRRSRKINVEIEQASAAASAREHDVDLRAQCDGVHDADEFPYPGLPEISREDLLRRLRDPSLTILDVHSTEVFAQEHLPRAINLPAPEIESRVRQVLPDREAEIAIYCSKYT